MMSYQAGNAIANTNPAQKAGTVERVKSGVGHSRSISDVVQPGRRYQSTIGQPKSLSNMLRPVPNTLNMPPPSRQFGQVPLGENPRISGRYHSFEPMRSSKENNTWCQAWRAWCLAPISAIYGCQQETRCADATESLAPVDPAATRRALGRA
jgi:hypothetical protein